MAKLVTRTVLFFFGIKITTTKHEIMLHAMPLKGGSRTSATELRSRILTAWDELDQRVIDMAVSQLRTRLRVLRRKTDTLNTN